MAVPREIRGKELYENKRQPIPWPFYVVEGTNGEVVPMYLRTVAQAHDTGEIYPPYLPVVLLANARLSPEISVEGYEFLNVGESEWVAQKDPPTAFDWTVDTGKGIFAKFYTFGEGGDRIALAFRGHEQPPKWVVVTSEGALRAPSCLERRVGELEYERASCREVRRTK